MAHIKLKLMRHNAQYIVLLDNDNIYFDKLQCSDEKFFCASCRKKAVMLIDDLFLNDQEFAIYRRFNVIIPIGGTTLLNV